VVHVDRENVLASVASDVRRAKGTASAFREHGRHGSDTRDGAAGGRRPAGKRHHSHQLGRPRRAYEASPPGPVPGSRGHVQPCRARRALRGCPGSGDSAHDRKRPAAVTAFSASSHVGIRPMSTALFSGTHHCAAATSSGTALRPLIARHAVTADQRARAVPDSTPLRELERHQRRPRARRTR